MWARLPEKHSPDRCFLEHCAVSRARLLFSEYRIACGVRRYSLNCGRRNCIGIRLLLARKRPVLVFSIARGSSLGFQLGKAISTRYLEVAGSSFHLDVCSTQEHTCLDTLVLQPPYRCMVLSRINDSFSRCFGKCWQYFIFGT